MNKNKNFIDSINILSGKIIYNDFDIDEEVSFEDQVYSFKEDILQIAFGDELIIDVGWYPEFQSHGHFLVRIIKNENWQNPMFKEECRTLDALRSTIEKAAVLIVSN